MLGAFLLYPLLTTLLMVLCDYIANIAVDVVYDED
jgi:hypothetical protein